MMKGKKPGRFAVVLSPELQKIVNYITSNPQQMQHQIAKGMDIPRNTVASSLHRLKCDGVLKQVGGGFVVVEDLS